jgi:hypothetical protein
MAEPRERDEPKQKTPAGQRIPIPTREAFDRFVRKVAGPGVRKRPDEKDPPPERSER